MRDSLEFSLILKLLGAVRFTDVATDVQEAVGGSPGRRESNFTPYRYQSQLWVGAVLSAAGLAPRIPLRGAGKKPDYLFDIDRTQYALEVKRPLKAANIPSKIDEAVRQLEDYHVSGGVAVDVSDCLPDELLYGYDRNAFEAPHGPIDAAFTKLYRSVGDHLFSPINHHLRPAGRRLFFAVVFAQGWRWFRTRPIGPELYSTTRIGVFVSAKGNLRYWHAQKISSAYIAGLRKTGLYPSRETFETL